MKREKKAERDTALWLNDDQESLLRSVRDSLSGEKNSKGGKSSKKNKQRVHKRQKDLQRAAEVVDALSGLGEQRRRRYWTKNPVEQEITDFYEPSPNPLRQEEQLKERKRRTVSGEKNSKGSGTDSLIYLKRL